MKRNRKWWIESVCGWLVVAGLAGCAFGPALVPYKARADLADRSSFWSWVFRDWGPSMMTDRVEAAADGYVVPPQP